MIKINKEISLLDSEVSFTFLRSPGPGGQNVNKVASAVLLRFNVNQSTSLSEVVRVRLVMLAGTRINSEGDLLIKATRFRTQERNKQDALCRLQEIIIQASVIPKKRKKTKPTYSSQQRRLVKKKRHSTNKSLRQSKPGLD